MMLAPLVVLPIAAGGGAGRLGGDAVQAPPLLTAALAVAVLAFGSGFLHLDGLADTADGLAVQGDRGRRLEVMRRGDVGPVGVVALCSCCSSRCPRWRDCPPARSASRWSRAAPRWWWPAHGESTGPRRRAGERGRRVGAAGPGRWSWARWRWPPVLSTSGVESRRGVAVAAAGVLVVVARRRIGGVTGDVLGACVELALAAYLVSQVVVIG